jgi:hypothetical protein
MYSSRNGDQSYKLSRCIRSPNISRTRASSANCHMYWRIIGIAIGIPFQALNVPVPETVSLWRPLCGSSSFATSKCAYENSCFVLLLLSSGRIEIRNSRELPLHLPSRSCMLSTTGAVIRSANNAKLAPQRMSL